MTVHSAGALPHHSYGGDSAGLVCGYLMQGSTPAMPLDRHRGGALAAGAPTGNAHRAGRHTTGCRGSLRLAAFQPGSTPRLPALDTAARPVARCVFEALKGARTPPASNATTMPWWACSTTHISTSPSSPLTLPRCGFACCPTWSSPRAPPAAVGGRPAHGRAAGLRRAPAWRCWSN